MNRFAIAFLLLMPGMTYAQDRNPETFKSVYARQDVSLQTNPNSQFWRGALSVYAEVDTQGKALPLYRTEVRSRWTRENLYLLYICPYEELYLKPAPDPGSETNRLWNW